jgi:hypothetical protein
MRSVHDLHHRLPRSHKGTNAKENLVRVPQVLHRAWHLMFRNWLPPQIAQELNKTWISPKWKMVAFEIKPRQKRKKVSILHEDNECIVYLKEK